MKKLLSAFFVFVLLGSTFMAQVQAAEKTPTINYLTKAVYDAIGIYSEDMVWVKEGSIYKYLNEKGKVVIDLSDAKYSKYGKISSVGDFHEGLALITLDDEEDYYIGGYFIDKKGKIVLTRDQVNKKIKNKENEISGLYYNFSQGVTITDSRPLDGNVLVIKKDGTAKKYAGSIDDYYWYTEDLLCKRNYNGDESLWGYVDKSFKEIISYQYEDARPFNQGLAPVKINGKWGFINKSGKIVIKAQFDDFIVHDSKYSYKVFNDGFAVVYKDGKWGAIDKKGKTVIDFKYNDYFAFANGYACVAGEDGKYTYIDSKGKTVIKTKYDDANFFTKSGVAVVGNDGVYKLINTKGKQVGKKTWKFDGTSISAMSPDVVKYWIGEKYGLAVIK